MDRVQELEMIGELDARKHQKKEFRGSAELMILKNRKNNELY